MQTMESPTSTSSANSPFPMLTPPKLMSKSQSKDPVKDKLLLKPKAHRSQACKQQHLHRKQQQQLSTPLHSYAGPQPKLKTHVPFATLVHDAPRFPDALTPDQPNTIRRPNLTMKKRSRAARGSATAGQVQAVPIQRIPTRPPLMSLEEPLEPTSSLLLPDIPADNPADAYSSVPGPARRLKMRPQPAC